MSDMKAAEANKQISTDNNVEEKVDGDASDEVPVILDQTEGNAMPSSQVEVILCSFFFFFFLFSLHDFLGSWF